MTMYPNYLAFARAHFGTARFNFALSGEHRAACLREPDAAGRPGAVEELRRALADFLSRDASEVVPCLGASQAMSLAAACLKGEKSVAALESPIYEPLRFAFDSAHGPRVSIERAARDDYALPRTLDASVQNADIIVLTNPNNPTGAATSDEALKELLSGFRGSVVVDDVYAPFDDYLIDGKWPGRARDLHPNAWVLGSLTKAFGVGPYRVGWLIVPPEARAAVDEQMVRAVGELPAAWATSALQILEQIPAVAREMKSTLAERKSVVVGALQAVPGLDVFVPARGPYCWVRLPEINDVFAHVQRWAREDGLVVSPGLFFGAPHGMRVSWTAPLAQLRLGTPLLQTRLRELIGSK